MNFLLALVISVALAKLLGEVMERIGLVSTLGEYIAGLILGGSFLAIIQPSDIHKFAIMGAVLLMFLAGYEETNIKFLVEHEKSLVITTIGSLVITLIALFLAGKYLFSLTNIQALFFSFIFGLTDVAVSAKTLLSADKLETEIGKSLLAMGVMDTIAGIIMLSLAIPAILAASQLVLLKTIGGIGAFFVLLLFMSKVLPKIVDKSVQLKTEQIDFSIALVSIFMLAYIAEELGIAAVLGAYFTGVILQKSSDLRSKEFNKTLSNIAYAFFVAVFFVWMGLKVNLHLLPKYLVQTAWIAGIAIFLKTGIVSLISKIQKDSWKKSIIKGISMSAKGADNLIIVAVGASLGVLAGIEEMLVVSVAVTILVSMTLSSIILKVLLEE